MKKQLILFILISVTNRRKVFTGLKMYSQKSFRECSENVL